MGPPFLPSTVANCARCPPDCAKHSPRSNKDDGMRSVNKGTVLPRYGGLAGHQRLVSASSFSIQPLKCGHCTRSTFRPMF